MGRAAEQVVFPNAASEKFSVPEEFRCPISGQVMADPVIIASGESYERSCIQAWLEQGQRVCYKSSAPLDHQLLIPNTGLKTAILGWSQAVGFPCPEPIPSSRAANLVKNLLKKPGGEDELGKMPPEAPAMVSPIRYVHSASGAALRELSGESGARIPHSLDINPSSLTLENPHEHHEPGGEELEPGAVQQLTKKLKKNLSEAEQSSAAATVRQLARGGAFNRRALGEPELLEALVALLQSPCPEALVNSAAAILNLSLEPENKLKIVRAGAVPRLIQALKAGSHPELQEHAAGAIFSLALHEENRLAIGVLGAIPPLIELLRNPRHPAGAQRDAAMALYYLSLAQLNRSKMVRAGLVPILVNGAEQQLGSRDLASRGLCILSCLASSSDGRAALLEINGIARLLGLLASASPAAADAEFREHAVAALLQLSHHNIRFKHLALQAGGEEILLAQIESATPRAREKIVKLLGILRDSPSPGNSFTTSSASIDPYFPRSYVRTAASRRGDYKAESSYF